MSHARKPPQQVVPPATMKECTKHEPRLETQHILISLEYLIGSIESDLVLHFGGINTGGNNQSNASNAVIRVNPRSGERLGPILQSVIVDLDNMGRKIENWAGRVKYYEQHTRHDLEDLTKQHVNHKDNHYFLRQARNLLVCNGRLDPKYCRSFARLFSVISEVSEPLQDIEKLLMSMFDVANGLACSVNEAEHAQQEVQDSQEEGEVQDLQEEGEVQYSQDEDVSSPSSAATATHRSATSYLNSEADSQGDQTANSPAAETSYEISDDGQHSVLSAVSNIATQQFTAETPFYVRFIAKRGHRAEHLSIQGINIELYSSALGLTQKALDLIHALHEQCEGYTDMCARLAPDFAEAFNFVGEHVREHEKGG